MDQDIIDYRRARDRAGFLFGSDVTDYLLTIQDAIGRHFVAREQLAGDPDSENRERLIDREYKAMIEISEFSKRLDQLVSPYMKMHQRVPL